MENDNNETLESCGQTTIRYPSSCTYICSCGHVSPKGGSYCIWAVKCGDYITEGTGIVHEPPKHPHTKIFGTLEAAAKILGSIWKRPVTVPKGTKGGKKIRRTLKGTPEEVAAALGLKLGPKRKR